MLPRRILSGLAAGALLTLGSTAGPPSASAAPPLGISSVRIFGAEDVAVVRAVCPVDPPTTAFITTEGELIGSVGIECTRRVQRITIPLTVDVVSGEVLQDVVVTVSGDSGEVSGFFDQVTVR